MAVTHRAGFPLPTMTPEVFQTAALAWLAALTLCVGPVAALIVAVLKHGRDIQAAWDLLHKHDEQLKDGQHDPTRIPGGPSVH